MCFKYYCFKSTLIIFITLNLSRSSLLNTPNLEDTLKQCLVSYQPQGDLTRCFGIGAISRLQSLDANPEFDFVDGLTLSRDVTQEYRANSYSFADQDPSDFRSIVDTFDHVFSKRAMRWDMGFLYPGLNMRVTPSISPGGVLEFVMDPNWEAANINRIQDVGTGRLLAKQFLLPLLLGFKFNVASLLPIMFGILVIIAKKAVLISKLALIVSTAFGVGSLLFAGGGNTYQPHTDQYYNGAHQYHPTSFGHSYKGFSEHQYPEEENLQYRGTNGVVMDQLKLYGSLSNVYVDRSVNDQEKKGRNFAWSEDEQKKIPDPAQKNILNIAGAG